MFESGGCSVNIDSIVGHHCLKFLFIVHSVGFQLFSNYVVQLFVLTLEDMRSIVIVCGGRQWTFLTLEQRVHVGIE